MKKISSAYLGRSLSLLMAVSMAFQALLAYGVGGWMDKQGAASGFVWLFGIIFLGLVLLGMVSCFRFSVKSPVHKTFHKS